MKFSTLIFLSISVLSLPHSLAGTREPQLIEADCQEMLLGELDRAPNDLWRGLVTRDVPMTVETLKAAYSRGIFPWVERDNGQVEWYSPPNRGILDLREVRIPRSDRKLLEKMLREKKYLVTFDRAFEDVIRACALVPRWTLNEETGQKRRAGHWISPLFIDQYTRLHEAGFAHSVEVWREGRLVGGLYGVFINGVFSGESMFHTEDNVTKLAFYSLILRLRVNGHRFIDTQQAQVVPKDNGASSASSTQKESLPVKWGAREIPRDEYLKIFHQAQAESLAY